MPSDHPARIEKLLNVLNFKEAIKLYMILPQGTLISEDLSSRSKLKPFMIVFIEDTRDLLLMSKSDILQVLLTQGETNLRVNDLAILEETLLKTLEEKIKNLR